MPDTKHAVGPFACPCGGTPRFEAGYSYGWYCVCECYRGGGDTLGFHATKVGAWLDWLWRVDAPCVVGWVRFPLKGGA